MVRGFSCRIHLPQELILAGYSTLLHWLLALVLSPCFLYQYIYISSYGPKDVEVANKYSVSVEEYKKTCVSPKETAESSAKCMSNAHAIYEVITKDGHYFDLTKRELNQVSKGDHLVFKHRQLVSINGHDVKK